MTSLSPRLSEEGNKEQRDKIRRARFALCNAENSNAGFLTPIAALGLIFSLGWAHYLIAPYLSLLGLKEMHSSLFTEWINEWLSNYVFFLF